MKISPKKTSEGILLSFEDYKKLMERLEDLEDSLELKKAIEEEEGFVSLRELKEVLEQEEKL